MNFLYPELPAPHAECGKKSQVKGPLRVQLHKGTESLDSWVVSGAVGY